MSEEPVFLITGASSGIGEATARQASERGYRLVLAARREDRVSALAEELGAPEKALAVRCDVTDWEDQQRLEAGAGLSGTFRPHGRRLRQCRNRRRPRGIRRSRP